MIRVLVEFAEWAQFEHYFVVVVVAVVGVGWMKTEKQWLMNEMKTDV